MDELEKRVRERIRENDFMNHNFMELETMAVDHAVFKLDIRPESRNPYGMVHGGAIYTLADNATGYAAHSDGRYYVTETSNLHFLRNQSEGTIRATAHVRHRGKSTCLVAVDITGENDVLLATGEYTFFCINREKLAEKAGK